MSFFSELKRRNVFRVGIAYSLIVWIALQVLDVVVGIIDAPAWVMQLALFIGIVGLVGVVIFSWIFEMTPEGLRKESEIDRSQSITPQTGRKLDRLIIAVLVVAVGILLVDKFLLMPQNEPAAEEVAAEAPAEEEATPSIAVLPFANMSEDAGNEFFSDGISEEILNSLARVEGLKVAGRTSSFAFKGRNEDLRMIGETLGVNHILEGSVRKSGNTVRITAQLVQASDGFHLWSDTYDRELTDIFAIQDEIAGAILSELKSTLIGVEAIASTRTDAEAYQKYLVARQRIYSRMTGQLEMASQLLDEVLEADPSFAPAWAQRGIVEVLLSDENYGSLPAEQAYSAANRHIDRALELDNGLAEAWAAKGLVLYQSQNREERISAIEPLEKALEINPALINASNWLQGALTDAGRPDDALRILEGMFERDPLYPPAVGNLSFAYARTNQHDKASAAIERVRPFVMPERLGQFEGQLVFWKGDFSESLAQLSQAQQAEPSNANIAFGRLISLFMLNDWETIASFDFPFAGPRMFALMQLDRPEEARMIALQETASNPAVLINYYVQAGDYRAAVQVVEDRWPDLDAMDSFYGGEFGLGYDLMLNVALAYLETGGQQRFSDAMRLARASHDRQIAQGADTAFLWANEASYWALMGDTDQAIENLERFVGMGFSLLPRFSDSTPQFRVLEGDPRYENLQARALEHLNRERVEAGYEPLEPAYTL